METNLPSPELRESKKLKVLINNGLVKRGATPPHGNKNRGVGITRKSKEESKKAKKLAKSQRQTNRNRANKKFRATGSKKRK
jgi:hypothetical protein